MPKDGHDVVVKFVSFQVQRTTDAVTSTDMLVIHALDDTGTLWRKTGGAPWKSLSTPESFTSNED